MRPSLAGAAAALALSAQATAADPSVAGTWITADRSAVVRIAECGASLCGTVVQVLATGSDVPRNDARNPNAALRARPLVGVRVLSGFSARGNQWSGGTAYDPKSGNSYRATLALAPGGRLKVTGCVLIVCRSQCWTRS
ncbi:MAG: hypothetical protein B7Z08_12375 [Sphingomonadales bacterium 32-68-7]|nr:MAG: hypothetical protein B7Z33_09100 [Sphingomonadales bacterium 12-68-11]OYX07434.1 MAG: hypothetical protein B7Z08_12375 [Sphingomonadales bacterium 32-68-7]